MRERKCASKCGRGGKGKREKIERRRDMKGKRKRGRESAVMRERKCASKCGRSGKGKREKIERRRELKV